MRRPVSTCLARAAAPDRPGPAVPQGRSPCPASAVLPGRPKCEEVRSTEVA